MPLTCEFPGAPGPIRTADTRFRRAVLCPLSYGGAAAIVAFPTALGPEKWSGPLAGVGPFSRRRY